MDKLLGPQRMSFNKEGIGYNTFNKKKTYKNLFVHEASKNKPHTICNYCLRKGHISYSCPLRKPNTKIIQLWVPKGTRPQNMITTYFGPKFDVKARKIWSIVSKASDELSYPKGGDFLILMHKLRGMIKLYWCINWRETLSKY